MKLTKAEKQVVANISRGLLTTPIIAVLAEEGHELTPDLLNGLQLIIDKVDTSTLQDAVATALVETGIDFKDIAKVDKYLAKPETQAVLRAVQTASEAVTPLVIESARAVMETVAELGAKEG